MAVLYTLVPRAAGATSAAHPGARYLLVTEFFEGATELGEAEVDEQVVDDGRSATAACS